MEEEVVEQENPYEKFTIAISLSPEEMLGRTIDTEEEANEFMALTDIFFSSEVVFGQLTNFVKGYFEQKNASKLIVPETKKLILPR